MGSTPEELNADIAGTRQALSTDMDALQDRVSPQAIMDRRKAAARSRVVNLKSRVIGAVPSAGSGPDGGGAVSGAQHRVEGNPLTAGAVAFLAGILVSAALPATDPESHAVKKAMDAAEEQGLTDHVKSAGRDLGSDLQDSAGQAVQEVKDSAQESAQRLKDEGQASADAVRSNSQG